MNIKNRPLLNTLMIFFIIATLTACQADTSTSLNSVQTPGISVDITNSTCPSITVSVGNQITWTNLDQSTHLISIKSADGKEVFSAGDLQPGDIASFIMSKAGNFTYACSSDQNSTGSITVEP